MDIIYEPKGKAREYAPLAANLYSGCAHGCTYCYAPSALRRKREDYHSIVKPRKNILTELEKDLSKGKFENTRVLLSFTTDPYQPIEESANLTRKALELFNRHNVNFEILTKGGSLASRDFGLYKSGDCFASTLTFINDVDSKKWEPNAALPMDRIETIKKAHSLGIETWASLEPVIDPVQSLEIIKMTSGFVDLFKIGKVNYVKDIDVDWKKFANDAISILEKRECRYYIKNDLKKYL